MKDVMAKALAPVEDGKVDRILAATFFRSSRTPSAGVGDVIKLDERRALVNAVRGSCL